MLTRKHTVHVIDKYIVLSSQQLFFCVLWAFAPTDMIIQYRLRKYSVGASDDTLQSIVRVRSEESLSEGLKTSYSYHKTALDLTSTFIP